MTSSRWRRRSIHISKSRRSIGASSRPAVRRCSSPTSRDPTSGSSPTCSAPPAAPRLAFGERPLRLIRRVVELVETIMPPTPAKLWGARDVGLELLKVGTRRASSGPVTERVTHDVRLDRLPAMTCWPEDGGPFITLPLVYTTHPDQARAQPRHVPHAGARRPHDRHALADRKGRRLSLRRRRGRGDRRCRPPCFWAGRRR